MSIRVGILGYGNLGRGVECAIRQNPDMELRAVFTRRAPETVKILTEGVPVYHVDEAEAKKDEIDVLILCGGILFPTMKSTRHCAAMRASSDHGWMCSPFSSGIRMPRNGRNF